MSRPVGYRESEETKQRKRAAMQDRWLQKKQPLPAWHPGFRAFGDRLDFLSAERQHLVTGRLAILPPKKG